jgi:cytochrome c oxidase subunit 2
MMAPVGKVVHVLVTGADVIHSFSVPAFGIKIDAVPGRDNDTWFKADRTGTFYGQCSQLCGTDHAYMPIEVTVVSQPCFDAWVASKQQSGAFLQQKNPACAETSLAAARGPAPPTSAKS